MVDLTHIKKILLENRLFMRYYFELKYLRGKPYPVEINPQEIEKFDIVRNNLDERFDLMVC